MDREKFDAGMAVRRAVLGDKYVDESLARADDFTRLLQELVTEGCWGTVWTRPGLPLKTRSLQRRTPRRPQSPTRTQSPRAWCHQQWLHAGRDTRSSAPGRPLRRYARWYGRFPHRLRSLARYRLRTARSIISAMRTDRLQAISPHIPEQNSFRGPIRPAPPASSAPRAHGHRAKAKRTHCAQYPAYQS